MLVAPVNVNVTGAIGFRRYVIRDRIGHTEIRPMPSTLKPPAMKPAPPLPTRRYLRREEAARWLGLSVETFDRLEIPYCDFGPRCRRFDVFDIIAFANENKRRDGARTSATNNERNGQPCNSTEDPARRIGGPHGTTGTEGALAEVLELKIAN